MGRRIVVLLAVCAVQCISASAIAQSDSEAPTLKETLTWLSGATDVESGDGNNHHTFESVNMTGCSVIITETRLNAGTNFWIKEAFSLSDIDPKDIYVEDLGKGQFKETFEGLSSVTFHTTNYVKKIFHTSYNDSEAVRSAEYIFFTNVGFAPRFAKALERAAELCGGKPSSF